MSKITLSFMQRFMENLDPAIRNFVDSKLGDKQDTPTLMSQTLNVGSTSVTFTGLPTTGVSIVDIYTSKAGLKYNSLDDSTAGSLTVTYEAQSSAVTVYMVSFRLS